MSILFSGDPSRLRSYATVVLDSTATFHHALWKRKGEGTGLDWKGVDHCGGFQLAARITTDSLLD
jgi:hypothetical protein